MANLVKKAPKYNFQVELGDGTKLDNIFTGSKDGQSVRVVGSEYDLETLNEQASGDDKYVIAPGDIFLLTHGSMKGHMVCRTGDLYDESVPRDWVDLGKFNGDSSVLEISSEPFGSFDAPESGVEVTAKVTIGDEKPVLTKFKVLNGAKGDTGTALTKFVVTPTYDEATETTTITITSQVAGQEEQTETFTVVNGKSPKFPFLAFATIDKPVDATAEGNGAIAMGSGSKAKNASIAIGTNSDATNANSIVIGTGSISKNGSQVVLGNNCTSVGVQNVSIGTNVKDTGNYGVGIGTDTSASGASAIGIGNGAKATVDRAIAIGAGATSSANGGMAFGISAECNATGGIVIGTSAKVNPNMDNSVAIGKGSIADRKNSVSIGTTDAPRQIIHVANATEDTDAVNLGQVKGMFSSGEVECEAKDTGGSITMKMGTQGTTGEGSFALYNSENLNRMTVTYVGGTLAENHAGVVVSLLQNDLCKFPSRNKNNNAVQLVEIGSTYDMYTTVAGSGIVDMVITIPMAVKVTAGGYTLKLKVQGYDKDDNPLIPQNLQFAVQVVAQ